MIEKIGDINLSSEHWDCECEQSYIHSMPEKSCPACGAEQEESPNSRADEVATPLDNGNQLCYTCINE